MKITRFQKDLFYELLWTAWNASWHTCNSRPVWNQNRYELKRNEEAFNEHSEKMLQKGIEIGLSEHVLNNLTSSRHGTWGIPKSLM